MNWNSVSEWMAMGGYAQYVWGSFGVCALGFVLEPLLIRQRQNQAVLFIRAQEEAKDIQQQ
jgi:heme exporter protein D